MSDRLHSLTVVLEQNMRADDAQCIVEAIRLLRGVVSVEQNVADAGPAAAVAVARNDIETALWETLRKRR